MQQESYCHTFNTYVVYIPHKEKHFITHTNQHIESILRITDTRSHKRKAYVIKIHARIWK